MHISENAYLKRADNLCKLLHSSPEGLSKKETIARLEKFGPNLIEKERKRTIFQTLIKQFKSPLVYILFVAGVVTLLLGHAIDTIVILVAVLLDVIVGFIQEYKASNALGALFESVIIKTTVIREGRPYLINASEVVPGDIVDLKRGDKVPADARIVSQKSLETDESVLTGESFPRKKSSIKIRSKKVLAERDNMLYMGTNVVAGSCRALIVATGKETELGKISESIRKSKEEKTPIQVELDKLARVLGILFIGIISLVFFIGVIRGHALVDMFTESVALAVSAIPESLPVAITVIFAIGMQKVLKKKGLIRKLLATETLGRTQILCIDKTATLTRGKMEVTQLSFIDKSFKVEDIDFEAASISLIEAIKGATLCNEAFLEINKKKFYRGNPTDIALLKLGHQFNLSKEHIQKETRLIDFFPFDQNLNMSASLIKEGKKNKLYVCGVPEIIIKKSVAICNSSAELKRARKIKSKDKEKILSKNNSLGSRGFRVLAVAYKSIPLGDIDIRKNLDDLTFLGLIVISDPLRESSVETVKRAINAGLRIVIVTGDHAKTAINIAQQVGIPCKGQSVITGDRLDGLSDEQLDKIITKISVFARVSPHDKVRIVTAWKRKGKVVAMTGDGVNDAPALNLADIGVALGSGTDVAKEAADLVLLNDDLKTILNAIEEGRGILDNIKKVVTYLFSDSLAEVVLVGFAILRGWPLPILPAQILWVNLVEDGLPDVALALESKEKDVLEMSPEVFKRPILDKEVKTFTLLIGWIDDIALISLFAFYFLRGYNLDFIRTMVFGVLTIDSLFFAYSCKSLRKPLWRTRLLNNKLLNFSFVLGIVLLIGAIYFPPLQSILSTVPIGAKEWLILIVVGLADVTALEMVKEIFIYKKFWKRNTT